MSKKKKATATPATPATMRADEQRLTVPLSAIVPTPGWEPQESKLAKLDVSFATLGDWTEAVHVVPGPKPGTYTQYEQRHRVHKLRQLMGPDHRVPIVVDHIDTRLMLRRLAESNAEGYGNSPADHAEVAQATVAQFAKELPALVSNGTVDGISDQAPSYYDAKSDTPFRSVKRSEVKTETSNGSKLPPFAYSAAMVAQYAGVNERSMVRALALLDGVSRVNANVSTLTDGLNRVEAETVAKVAASMANVDKRPVGDTDRAKLKRFARELRAVNDGIDTNAGVVIDGKKIDVRKLGEDGIVAVATALRTDANGSHVRFASETEETETETETPATLTESAKRAKKARAIADRIEAAAKMLSSNAKASGAKLFTDAQCAAIVAKLAEVNSALAAIERKRKAAPTATAKKSATATPAKKSGGAKKKK